MKTVILGGGPCGLGAAWRLQELGCDDWVLCERNAHWGGLAASFQDEEGFIWDIGGHVLFSHYHYFDRVMDELLGKTEGWLFHEREAWVRMADRFIPYPFQNNIHRLPQEIYWECLKGVIDLHENPNTKFPRHFGEWITATFGSGIAKWFLNPYNLKVWAFRPEQMDWSWVGERVAPVNLKSILKNAVFNRDAVSWGPNNRFRFPRFGGTGAIWTQMAKRLPSEKMYLERAVERVDAKNKKVLFSDGSTEAYDLLLSTLPLIDLIRFMGENVESPASSLKFSGTHVVGLGIKGAPPESLSTKCWIYFPEDNSPFYRGTVFSNYSPNNVPDSERYWSLMLEVSQSPVKPVDHEQVVESVVQGGLNAGLLTDRSRIHHTWHHFVNRGYPTPFLGRNEIVFPLLKDLENHRIFSRGRFGAWRYEVGNMDHSFMQGVEWANALMASGEELTLWYPDIVNNAHPSGRSR